MEVGRGALAPGGDPVSVAGAGRRGGRGAGVTDPGGPGGSAGIRYMVLSAFWFSLMGLFVKIAGTRLPTQEIVLGRAVVTVALSYIGLRRAGIRPWGRNRPLLVLRGLLGFGGLSCFYYAVARLPLADATVIQYTNPIFTALIAAWFLGERVGAREALCVVISLAGVVLVARPSFLFGATEGWDTLAAGVGLLGAIMTAGAYVLVRKLGETEAPLVIVFYFALISVVASMPMVAAAPVMPTPVEWLVLLGVGLTTQAGQVYLTRGLQVERAGRATSVGYLQILFAVVWGLTLFGELPGRGMVLGASLIVASTVILSRSSRRGVAPARTEDRGAR